MGKKFSAAKREKIENLEKSKNPITQKKQILQYFQCCQNGNHEVLFKRILKL